jgi:hypothetical protein
MTHAIWVVGRCIVIYNFEKINNAYPLIRVMEMQLGDRGLGQELGGNH